MSNEELKRTRDDIVAAMRKCADDLWALAKEAKEVGRSRYETGPFLFLKDQSAKLHARCVELEHLELP